MPLVLIGLAPLIAYFYCLLKYPKGTMIVSVIGLVAFGVQRCSLGQAIVGEPVGMSWVQDPHPQGYPWKEVKIKVINQSDNFYSWFRLSCTTPHGTTSLTDGSGILANTSEYRSYKVEDSGVSEIYQCKATSVTKGKPQAYASDWTYSTWADRVYEETADE